MPVFPGTEPPVLNQANTIARDGFAEKKIKVCTATPEPTWMRPAHMLEGGKTSGCIWMLHPFMGMPLLIDVRANCQSHIEVDIISRYEEQLKRSQILILRTGWAERWGREDYFMDFPALSQDAAPADNLLWDQRNWSRCHLHRPDGDRIPDPPYPI